MEKEKLWRIRVFGIVQGVGFRPTVHRHADSCGIRGNVSNVGPYVEIWAKGPPERLERFQEEILSSPPKRAVILKIAVEEKDPGLMDPEDFLIIDSEKREGDIFVSPDIAICPDCQREMYDPSDRRYLHPFINCTCCGPRLTILDAMPYDRVRTSMADFPMCPQCHFEYTHASSRRYDAQPVCCNDCGPEVYLLDRPEKGPEAIRAARAMIKAGGIVGIKGIGGFHLCCDAKNEKAVRLLRERKKRPVKPFALMMKDLSVVKRECLLTEDQEEILDGHQKPILLLPRRKGGEVAPCVAPGNPKLGVMLPYAPIQLLLFDYRDDLAISDCLVMTSANRSGAPICRDDEDARRELSDLCDLVLSHNRLIRLRADDTVMDYFEGYPYMIRRSRGYAPLPVMTEADLTGEVLAIGGELKNTFCIGKNQLFYPSPYIGDMGDVRTVKALKESIGRMEELLEVKPSLVACDLHPAYQTTALAESLGLPLLKVQHHYAHILSCMAENDWREPVIGVAFDGTGYGTDGTIWGGEFLLADLEGFSRCGSIHPFLHVGGDSASKEGWRIAVSLIHSLYGREQGGEIIRKLGLCSQKEAAFLMTMAEKKINSIVSTSMGRIFDAVSAILGICRINSYEGEASIFLQFAGERAEEADAAEVSSHAEEEFCGIYLNKTVDRKTFIDHFQINENRNEREEGDRLILRTDQLVRDIIERRLAGEDAETLALYFHQWLAEGIRAVCLAIRKKEKVNTVALSGGVFQNQLLLKQTAEVLRREGFQLLLHRLIPPNDGGICLGQALAAMTRINS